MKQAIAELQRTAEIAENNLPISEQAGDTAQAELDGNQIRLAVEYPLSGGF